MLRRKAERTAGCTLKELDVLDMHMLEAMCCMTYMPHEETNGQDLFS